MREMLIRLKSAITQRRTAGTVFRRCSDDQLMRRSTGGDLDARHELLGRYCSILQATASRMTHNPRDAEDLAGELYLHVFRVLPSCNNARTLPGWIKRVAINAIYQKWRHERRQPLQSSLEALVETSGDGALSDPSQDPAVIFQESAWTQERSERFDQALASLPEHQRALCDLYYGQSHSVKQIAQATGLPTGTIKSRLFRARENMHRKLVDFISG